MKNQNFGKPLCRLITMVAICMLSLNAMAYSFSYTYQGKTLYYNITSSNTVAVTYYSPGNDYQSNNYVSGAVVIPSSVTNNGTTYSVTSIGYYAFSYCSSLTSVTIPNSVTSIYDYAFKNCSSLTSVTIPNSVTSIYDYAFENCSSLTSVTLPNNATIHSTAFGGAGAKTTIDSITYCSGTLTIGNYTLTGTGFLTFYLNGNAYFPNNARVYYCDRSKSGDLIIPSTISYNGTTYSVTSIHDYAFIYCISLTSVTIPNSVTSIGCAAFLNCSSLSTLNFNAANCGDFPDERVEHPFRDCPISTINIGDSVQRIPTNFAREISSLTTLNFNAANCGDFPDEWSEHPFRFSPISTINIGDSVQRIPANFARYISSLTSVTIGNSVTSIGNYAFYECSSLTSVTIGNSVTSIGNYAFYECSSLTSVTIGNSVTSIGNNAFQNCSSLTSVTIGNSVTSIGNNAFQDCSSLTSLTIPNSVTSIGDFAFMWCSSLTSVAIPNSVTSIGEGVFQNCSSLTSVTIGNSVTSIGNNAFQNCSSLTSVTIGNSVTSIGNNAFQNCSSLTSLTIPNSVTSIGDFAFMWCSSLTSVAIPNSVTSIGEGVFSYCSSLTSFTIGSGLTSIGNSAFYGCGGLTSIVSNAVIPPAIGGIETFPYPNICSVTVPCGSLGAYTAPVCYWSVFFPNRITEEGDVFDVSVAANDDSFGSVSVESQSCSVKVITATPSNCKSFAAWNDGNTDNPRTITVTSDTSFTAIFESVELSHNITAAICEGTAYTENNFNVSEAGVYTQNLQTINGCDSIVTLTLTVSPVAITALQAAICEGTTYTENGFNVSEAGVYTQNLQTINGCDSTITLTLTVNPVVTTNLNASICQGETYTENGFNVSEAGVYTQNLQTINGCDSTVTLTLVVNPIATTTLQAAICEGTAYTENGFNVSEAGVYTQNLQTINGCDSVVTLTLTVNPVYSFTIDATINQGETYHGNGFEVSEAGTYTQNLQTVNGCDSVIVLELTVNSSLGDVVANTIEVALYPNPAENYTVLKVQGLNEQTKVALFDVRGRKLREFDLSAGTESVRLDLRDLPSGVYTLMIGNTTKKLIVE